MTGIDSAAILLMAYGSPNSLSEVGPYLSQVRGGREPSPEQIDRLKERYRQVGGRTPLLRITQAQAKALENRLRERELDLPVYVGMKHWNPFIEDVVQNIVRDGARSILGIALAPHYSRLSIGGYEAAVVRGLNKVNSKIPFTMVKSWHKEEHLINALSRRVRDGLGSLQGIGESVVLFTAHSLPRAVSLDDPYESQLCETSKLIAKNAGVEKWDFAFQSAGEPRDDWLGPQILEQISKLANQDGFSKILVCPIGFVSDHLEIMYDLDIEAQQYGKTIGAILDRTASLNDDPEFIDALTAVTVSNLKQELVPLA